MPRYIDADKLLARYKERCAGCKFTPNHCEHFCDIADVISDIEDAPTADVVERKKGWIPCSEKLPEVRQWVLCQCRAGIMDVLRLTADGSWSKNYPRTKYMSCFVVAWMPLPEPYQSNVEEKADEHCKVLEEPTRKKGKWEMKWQPFFHIEVPMCSVCETFAACKTEVCPHCGADMREEKNDVGSEV